MTDSRNSSNRNNNHNQDEISRRDNQQNTSTRDLSADESLQKETKENDRLTTGVPDNYERDSE
jgi:hypothetical protein